VEDAVMIGLVFALAIQTGALSGTIELPPPPKSNLKLRYVGQTGASAKKAPDPSPAVVWLDGVPGDFKPDGKNRVIDQEGIEFRPRVLPVLVGTTVDFPNKDKVHHNVFSLSRVKKFDLGRYPTGESRGVAFDQPGVVKIYCEIHEHMKAFVIAVSNPFFATTDAQGSYRIEGIPPGTYTLVAWHENGAEIRRPVTIPAGAAVENLKFGAAAPDPSALAARSCCGG
jgi:plastocyanin